MMSPCPQPPVILITLDHCALSRLNALIRGPGGALSMDLLFKREQTSGEAMRVRFKLWAKIELDTEEQGLINRYKFDRAMLIEVLQPDLLRKAIYVGVAAFIGSAIILPFIFGKLAAVLCIGAGIGAGWWYANEKRETIYVRDLMHGRNFKCDSVVDLARKEAWLATVVSFLRQVMETAKHWDGTESQKIEPLTKDEARQVILRGL